MNEWMRIIMFLNRYKQKKIFFAVVVVDDDDNNKGQTFCKHLAFNIANFTTKNTCFNLVILQLMM